MQDVGFERLEAAESSEHINLLVTEVLVFVKSALRPIIRVFGVALHLHKPIGISVPLNESLQKHAHLLKEKF